MQILPRAIPDVKLIVPKKFGDARGFFSEVYNRQRLRDSGIDLDWVQDNHSLSVPVGVVRALHYQLPPLAQAKLVRVIRGEIFDVAVDIRRGSPTFGQFVAEVLSSENWAQLYVPVGFAHGFVTLKPNTEVIYKVSAPYSPPHERGIRWDDPTLDIPWGLDAAAAVLSDRDRLHPAFADAVDLF